MGRTTKAHQHFALGCLHSALIGAGVISEDAPDLYVEEGNSSYGYGWSVYDRRPASGRVGRLIVESSGSRKDFVTAIKGATRVLDLINP